MVTGTNTTDYLLDGQSVVREIKNGVVNATYLNGPRGPEYKRNQNGAVAWYLYDGLGSVVGTVDESGNVTNTRKYDVYGAPRNAQTGTAHCFVGSLGHTSDAETGLVYMRARYMDPATGRFVSEDPARSEGNWLAYAQSSPVMKIDRDGRLSEDQTWNIGMALVFAVSALLFFLLAMDGQPWALAVVKGLIVATAIEIAGAITDSDAKKTAVTAILSGLAAGLNAGIGGGGGAKAGAQGLAASPVGAIVKRQGEVQAMLLLDCL